MYLAIAIRTGDLSTRLLRMQGRIDYSVGLRVHEVKHIMYRVSVNTLQLALAAKVDSAITAFFGSYQTN